MPLAYRWTNEQLRKHRDEIAHETIFSLLLTVNRNKVDVKCIRKYFSRLNCRLLDTFITPAGKEKKNESENQCRKNPQKDERLKRHPGAYDNEGPGDTAEEA